MKNQFYIQISKDNKAWSRAKAICGFDLAYNKLDVYINVPWHHRHWANRAFQLNEKPVNVKIGLTNGEIITLKAKLAKNIESELSKKNFMEKLSIDVLLYIVN